MPKLLMPEDLEGRVERFPEVNWSAVVRKAIAEKLERLAFLEHFASESELTEEDAIKLGRKVNKRLAGWYRGK